MRETKLQRASLNKTNLNGAILRYANLHKAKLLNTQLLAANLGETNLKEATLKDVEFDESTTLPDGSNWSPETDMRRYTDPAHPDFWQPDWVKQQEKED